jgi:hypothetical protein
MACMRRIRSAHCELIVYEGKYQEGGKKKARAFVQMNTHG